MHSNKGRWPGAAKMRGDIKRIRQEHQIAIRLRGNLRMKRCPDCYGSYRYCKTCLGSGEVVDAS